MTTTYDADCGDVARLWSYCLIPWRCLTSMAVPADHPVQVESVELWATCPDGWHESPVFYAGVAP